MPVRKIPKNYRNVTGVFPSRKSLGSAAFESTLERDFFTILDFDNSIVKFEVQPVRIEYKDKFGKNRSYTPDVLVQYRQNVQNHPTKNCLYEVKYRQDLNSPFI